MLIVYSDLLMLLQETVGNITKSYLDLCKLSPSQAAPALQLPEQPSPSEILLTSFPSINPLSAARLISLGCSLSELLTLSAEEQKQLTAKLSDIPANSLELFFQQATWGQAITGLLPTAPGQRLQQNALEYDPHNRLGNDRQETQADEYREAGQTRQPAGLLSKRHQNMLDNHTRPLASMPPSPHASGMAVCGNPFQTFQYRPQHQSSSKSHDTKQLLQACAHDDKQHDHLSTSMGSRHDSGSFEIEKTPLDYTDDRVYNSLAPAVTYSHQQHHHHHHHHHNQRQQQQHNSNWQSYLHEEEQADDTMMESPVLWQPARHRFTDEHCNHAGAADEEPMYSLQPDHLGDDGVPDVVIDDVLDGMLLLWCPVVSHQGVCKHISHCVWVSHAPEGWSWSWQSCRLDQALMLNHF